MENMDKGNDDVLVIFDDYKVTNQHMQKASKFWNYITGVALILLAFSCLTLGTGDPSIPSILGLIMFTSNFLLGVGTFKKNQRSAFAFIIITFIFGIYTYKQDPWGFINSNSFIYFFIARSGCVIFFSIASMLCYLKAKNGYLLPKPHDKFTRPNEH